MIPKAQKTSESVTGVQGDMSPDRVSMWPDHAIVYMTAVLSELSDVVTANTVKEHAYATLLLRGKCPVPLLDPGRIYMNVPLPGARTVELVPVVIKVWKNRAGGLILSADSKVYDEELEQEIPYEKLNEADLRNIAVKFMLDIMRELGRTQDLKHLTKNLKKRVKSIEFSVSGFFARHQELMDEIQIALNPALFYPYIGKALKSRSELILGSWPVISIIGVPDIDSPARYAITFDATVRYIAWSSTNFGIDMASMSITFHFNSTSPKDERPTPLTVDVTFELRSNGDVLSAEWEPINVRPDEPSYEVVASNTLKLSSGRESNHIKPREIISGLYHVVHAIVARFATGTLPHAVTPFHKKEAQS